MIVLFLFLWLITGFLCWATYIVVDKRELTLNDFNDDMVLLTLMGGLTLVVFMFGGLGKLWDVITTRYGKKPIIKLPPKKEKI